MKKFVTRDSDACPVGWCSTSEQTAARHAARRLRHHAPMYTGIGSRRMMGGGSDGPSCQETSFWAMDDSLSPWTAP